MTGAAATPAVGIEALNAFCGHAYVMVQEMFEARGLSLDRLKNLMMERRSLGLPIDDPVTNAVNAARPIVDALTPAERGSIEMLVTSTESGVDFSKSVASYVHEYLGLSRNCRLVEVKQACYAATAAVQTSVGYLASGVSPGARALIIGTDVALVNERAEYTEPTIGAGAAAILLGSQPRVMTFDSGAFGNYSFETLDSARPTPDYEIVDVDGSLFAYLDCLSGAFAHYQSRVRGAAFASTFDYLALHTPFAGLVKAAHRKMMRDHGTSAASAIEADFQRRVRPSLLFPMNVGNLCSASLYLALASIIEHEALERPCRVGLFSYGSGCSSEFFSGVIDRRLKEAMAAVQVGARLERRRRLAFSEYAGMLEENLRCLVPTKDRRIDVERYRRYLAPAQERPPVLAFTGVEGYRRRYEWI